MAVIGGAVSLLLGVPSALSFGRWSQVQIFNLTIFNFMDYLASNICLPVGGLCITIFVGWFWGRENALPEIKQGARGVPGWVFSSWRFLIRFVAPILISLVLLSSIGLI
jgi:NSS family neurotransmitter:Na+ symporter